jgi:hypothetical protein
MAISGFSRGDSVAQLIAVTERIKKTRPIQSYMMWFLPL